MNRRKFVELGVGAVAHELMPRVIQPDDNHRYWETHPVSSKKRVGVFGRRSEAELERVAEEVAGQPLTNEVDDMLVGETGPSVPQRPPVGETRFGFSVDYGKNQLEADRRVGRNSDYQGLFVFVGNNPRLPIERFIPGKIPLIFIEFFDYNKVDPVKQPEFNYASFLNGNHGRVITEYITQAKQYGKPIYFTPWNEMNGDWNAWGLTVNGNSADLHIRAWHKFKQMIDNAGATNIKLTWVVNARSVPDIPANQIGPAFPDKKAVDATGSDGFNFIDRGRNLFPDELFTPPVKTLTELAGSETEQLIASTGSKAFSDRGEWYKQLLVDLVKKYPQLKGIVLFDIAPFDLAGDNNTIDAIRSALQNKTLYDPIKTLRPQR